MADITMCANSLCPLAGTCYRATATPNPHWQSVMLFQYALSTKGVQCDNYLPTTRIEAKEAS